MKYLITESQREKIIFKYLDNQDFVTMEYGTYEYFLNSENDEYAQIKFNERSRWCTIEKELMVEIASFFSLEYREAMSLITKWVENKVGVEFNTIETQSEIIVRYFK
jgi:DNA polymerase III sliding clamp (beta) subunit (PCNA family)